LDPCIIHENIGKEQNVAAHQRNKEKVKCLQKWDILEVLGEYLPEALDSVFDTEIHGCMDRIKSDGVLLRAMQRSLIRENIPHNNPAKMAESRAKYRCVQRGCAARTKDHGICQNGTY
jgi:hypothetical protein